MRYIPITRERLGTRRFKEALTVAAGRDEKEVIVTLWDQLQEEGRKEGRKEGRRKTLLEQLTAKFGSVPIAVRARVAATDEATLRCWSLRVLTETTLAEVLRSPKPRAPKKAAHGGRLARV